ncbi:MAG: DUF1552 domain-containing protein [Pseudomonadota bacterium]
MFLTRKSLSRRTFLRNAGICVGLPLLDAMIPAHTALAQTAARAVPKLGFIYFPHGAVMDQWTPDTIGRDFILKSILQPLAPYQDKLTVISGLENRHATGPVHAIAPGTWLSAVTPRVSHDPNGGVTIDQIAAQHIGQDTPLPSIELALEESGGSSSCDRDYGCSYASTTSFRTPTTPLPMEHNPGRMLQHLFGQGGSEQERKSIAGEYGSLLDMVTDQAASLRRKLGIQDRVRIDDFLDTVREIERRVQKLEAQNLAGLAMPQVPAGIPESIDEHLNLMFDMIHIAWQSGATRVASFMMAAEASNKTYNHLGIADAFHPLSHHQNNPAKMDRLAVIQKYNTQVFSRFVGKLAATKEGEGSMLDNAILLFGSNMSDSNVHNNFPLPLALVGGGCGRIKGGQHLRYPDRTPIANLLLTVLDRARVPVTAVGDSTGAFAEV